MIHPFFQIAWRNLMKRKFYSLINITGLAIGMACCLLITLYVQQELSYDQYHTKYDHIYRVLQSFRSVQNGENPGAPTPGDFQVWGCAPVGPALRADFPEVEKVVQFMSPVSLLLQQGEKRFQQDNLLFRDSVLGASVSGIVLLLSKDFIKLILIAIAIAIPLCWWAMNQWLQALLTTSR